MINGCNQVPDNLQIGRLFEQSRPEWLDTLANIDLVNGIEYKCIKTTVKTSELGATISIVFIWTNSHHGGYMPNSFSLKPARATSIKRDLDLVSTLISKYIFKRDSCYAAIYDPDVRLITQPLMSNSIPLKAIAAMIYSSNDICLNKRLVAKSSQFSKPWKLTLALVEFCHSCLVHLT